MEKLARNRADVANLEVEKTRQPGAPLDADFVKQLNDGLKVVLKGIDPSRMAITASLGLPWSTGLLEELKDLKGLPILDSLRQALLKILENDHPMPADFQNMLEVVAAVAKYA